MGMFDSFYATVTCPVCNSTQEQEIQTKRGECRLNKFRVGDSILDKGFGVRTGEIETYFYCHNEECPTCIWVDNPDGKTRSTVDKTRMSAKLFIKNYRFVGAKVWRDDIDEEPELLTDEDRGLLNYWPTPWNRKGPDLYDADGSLVAHVPNAGLGDLIVTLVNEFHTPSH